MHLNWKRVYDLALKIPDTFYTSLYEEYLSHFETQIFSDSDLIHCRNGYNYEKYLEENTVINILQQKCNIFCSIYIVDYPNCF